MFRHTLFRNSVFSSTVLGHILPGPSILVLVFARRRPIGYIVVDDIALQDELDNGGLRLQCDLKERLGEVQQHRSRHHYCLGRICQKFLEQPHCIALIDSACITCGTEVLKESK